MFVETSGLGRGGGSRQILGFQFSHVPLSVHASWVVALWQRPLSRRQPQPSQWQKKRKKRVHGCARPRQAECPQKL
eukprot:6059092-Amphidinium_carterae.1